MSTKNEKKVAFDLETNAEAETLNLELENELDGARPMGTEEVTADRPLSACDESEATEEEKDASEATVNSEYMDETTFSGWFFLRIVLFAIPILGLILSIISVYKNDNKSRKNFAKAFVVYNCLGILFFAMAAYIAAGYIKVAEGSARDYLGDYGSSTALISQLAAGDTMGALKKLNLDRLSQRLAEDKVFESEEVKYFLSNMDLSKLDFSLIDWSKFTDEEIRSIIKSLPEKK